jgi:hypothetical protein
MLILRDGGGSIGGEKRWEVNRSLRQPLTKLGEASHRRSAYQ